jgi:chromosome condensin MukBEF ATPase and DNA-binding subunit MukB
MSSINLEKVLTMTESELEELNKKIKKQMIKKFVINIATGVVVHFAVGFIINMIDTKKNETEEPTE